MGSQNKCGLFALVVFVITDLVLFGLSIKAMSGLSSEWETLLRTTKSTSGTYDCGFKGPVNVFVPIDQTLYAEKYFNDSSRVYNNRTYDQRVDEAIVAAGCSPITHTQTYFGLLYLNPNPGGSSTTELIIKNRNRKYNSYIAGWVLSFLGALILSLISSTASPNDLTSTGRFRLLLGELYYGFLVETYEQYLINLYLVSLNETSFVNLTVPLSWTYLNIAVVFMVSASFSRLKEDNDDEDAVFIFGCCAVVFLILVLIPSVGYAAYSSNYYNQIQRMGSGTSTVDFTDAYSEIAGFVDTLTGLGYATVVLTFVKPTIASVIFCLGDSGGDG